MLRGICKLPSLKDISPLIRSEQQTCFLSQKSKMKSAEHVPMSLHLPLRYWILCFDGHQSVGPWAYETQYLFLMTPKTFFFCVVACPEINSLSESRGAILLYEQNRRKNGYLTQWGIKSKSARFRLSFSSIMETILEYT